MVEIIIMCGLISKKLPFIKLLMKVLLDTHKDNKKKNNDKGIDI